VQPKLVAVSATVATAAAATAAYYPEPAGGRHGDGISADGDAAARVPTSGVNVAAVAERNARGRSAEPALESMAKRTPKEGKGGGGGDIHVVSSLAAAGAVVLLHARRWLAK
jgi:Flp pilus assembly protein TadB